MKKTLSLLLFSIVSILTFAQQGDQDLIYLQNGTVIRGTIADQFFDELIEINLDNSGVFVCPINQILKIQKVPLQKQQPEQSKSAYSNESTKTSKSISILEAAYGKIYDGLTIDGRKPTILEFDFIRGYQSESGLLVGFGMGVIFIPENGYYDFPVFIDIRTVNLNKIVFPFFAVDIGYFIFGHQPYISPTVGLQFRTKQKSTASIGINYEAIKYEGNGYKLNHQNQIVSSIVKLSCFSLKISYTI